MRIVLRVVVRIIRWSLISLVVLLLLLACMLVAAYVIVGRDLARVHAVALREFPVPGDAAAVTAGERLARMRGCYNGCHGTGLEGSILWQGPDGSRLTAPNLTRAVREYSPAELERVIRHGVKQDGTSVVVMPSRMFSELNDADLGAIVAFLRSAPEQPHDLPPTHFGPLARAMGLVAGLRGNPQFEAAEIDHTAPRIAVAAGAGTAAGTGSGTGNAARTGTRAATGTDGRYLARTACTECHGTQLRGAPDGSAPNLAMVKAYSLADFTRLMRTGIPLGDRVLPLMGRIAPKRFAYFTEAEIAAVHGYLQTLE